MAIHLSKKHGVNPSLEICAVCGKKIGVALLGRLKNDAEAPGEVRLGNLCDTCQGVVDADGTLIIETVDGEPCSKNPTRTGRIVGITHEAAERLFHSHAPVPIWYIPTLQIYSENHSISRYYSDITVLIRLFLMR